VTDGASVQAKNAISVVMEDLTEADRKDAMHKLKEELAEIRNWKLACFRKTRNRVVKKVDTMTASPVKVTSHLSPEDLVHMVDVSVASKY
jgi:ribosome recycling factor